MSDLYAGFPLFSLMLWEVCMLKIYGLGSSVKDTVTCFNALWRKRQL